MLFFVWYFVDWFRLGFWDPLLIGCSSLFLPFNYRSHLLTQTRKTQDGLDLVLNTIQIVYTYLSCGLCAPLPVGEMVDADGPAVGQIPVDQPEAAALTVSTYCDQPSCDPQEEQTAPFADAPFTYKTIHYEAKSAEPIRVQRLVCGLEDTPIWGIFLITDRRLIDPHTNLRVHTTKRTITMFGGQVDPPIEAYSKSTLPAGWRRMAVLQEPFGRLTSMEDDAPLIQPGQLWQYGNGTMIVARNVAELNLIVKRVTVFQKWSLSTRACATNTWLEDIECGHVLQYAEQGPILVDLGEIPRSIQGNHVTFREITIAPWFDISKESQDHLVACTLDYCAKMDTEDAIKLIELLQKA